MKKIVVVLLSLSAVSLYAQQSRPKNINDAPQIKERLENNGQRVQAEAKVSQYHGFEARLTSMMKDGRIPSDCPTGIMYPDRTKYISVLNSWLKENQEKINENNKGLNIEE